MVNLGKVRGGWSAIASPLPLIVPLSAFGGGGSKEKDNCQPLDTIGYLYEVVAEGA